MGSGMLRPLRDWEMWLAFLGQTSGLLGKSFPGIHSWRIGFSKNVYEDKHLENSQLLVLELPQKRSQGICPWEARS